MVRMALACLLVGVVHASAQSLPAIPSFDLPPSEPGFTNVRELRVAGTRLLDTDVKVRGYVIWIYDCLADVAKRGESRAKTQKRIDEDPSICERKKFYLGSSKNEPREKGLWIVDVPRPLNKLERERLPKEDIKAWPKVPKVKLGEYVTVSGKFALRSPHSEANSDGLVVFAAIEPAKPQAIAAPVTAPKPRPVVADPQTKQRPVPAIDEPTRQKSIKAANEATRLYANGFNQQAITTYNDALKDWPGNHLALYGLAGAHIGDGNWNAARIALERALEFQPKDPTYNMLLGYVLYESAFADARDAQAKQQGRTGAEIRVDTSGINYDKALGYLSYATKLSPTLWRAHYYIGRIHRDHGDARWAAESLDIAVRARGPEAGPWVALVELYRRWDYMDEALAVATAGTAALPKEPDLWYMRGRVLDDKLMFTDAIEMYTKALELKPDLAKAMFQRGQVYMRVKNRARGKADLEAYLKANPEDMWKQAAERLLMEIP